MDDVKRILVVSRSTGASRKAFHYGVSLARKYEAELFVVHVIYDYFRADRWNLPIPNLRSLQDGYKKMEQVAKAELDALIELEKAKGMPIREIIKEGDPVEETLRIVTKEKIDLVVIPAHEEGRIEHLLFSRDVEKLIRTMPCSILLVKEEPA
ncbi:MAG: universal stress protein [Deltaproteobacteria bacterium]|nr:universal stress protein [Deltaproteobacteria bacterium]MBW2123407.1 universal stress protein [Deltaproteobacteria bacterium]